MTNKFVFLRNDNRSKLRTHPYFPNRYRTDSAPGNRKQEINENGTRSRIVGRKMCRSTQLRRERETKTIAAASVVLGAILVGRSLTVALANPTKPAQNLTATWDNGSNLTLAWGYTAPDRTVMKFIVEIHSNEETCHAHVFPVKNASDAAAAYSYVAPIASNCLASSLRVLVTPVFENSEQELSLKLDNVTSPPGRPKFSYTPFFTNRTVDAMTLQVPTQELQNGSSNAVYVFVTGPLDAEVDRGIYANEAYKELWDFAALTNASYTWLVGEFVLNGTTNVRRQLLIGANNKSRSLDLNVEIFNRPLRPNTTYTITMLLVTRYGGFERHRTYTSITNTLPPQSTNTFALNYVIPGVFVLAGLPIVLWRIRRARRLEDKITWSLVLCQCALSLARSFTNESN